MWFFRIVALVNCWPHCKCEHLKAFVWPSWTKWEKSEIINQDIIIYLSRNSNYFSTLPMETCFVRFPAWLKVSSQNSHLWIILFSVLMLFWWLNCMWVFRPPLENDFPQNSHLHGSWAWAKVIWEFKSFSDTNDLSQLVHLCEWTLILWRKSKLSKAAII